MTEPAQKRDLPRKSVEMVSPGRPVRAGVSRGSAAVVEITYIMHGKTSGVFCSWIVTGTPDTDGSRSGISPTPTDIRIAQKF